MKKIVLNCLSFILAASVSAQDNEAYFLSQPALTPDGKSVVFSFEGDIWKASLADGQAYRLTAMERFENNAKVWPDGNSIAFTVSQYSNADVYVRAQVVGVM